MVTSLPARDNKSNRIEQQVEQEEDETIKQIESRESARNGSNIIKSIKGAGGGRDSAACSLLSLSAWQCVPDWIGFGVLPPDL